MITITSAHAILVRNLFDARTVTQLKQHLQSRRVKSLLSIDESNTGFSKWFSRRYSHNPSFLVEAHRHLTDVVSDVVGERLKPSYAFLSIYDANGRCPLHVDRPQCRWTIDYMIEQDVDEPWPIYISEPLTEHERRRDTYDVTTQEQAEKEIAKHDWVAAVLQPNDAVIYSGTHQWHYRRPIVGRSCSLAFFHFVPEDFDGPLS